MKRTLALLLTLVLLPVMSACAGSSASAESTSVQAEAETDAQEEVVETPEQDVAAESATEQEITTSENNPKETQEENEKKMIYARVGEQVLEILPADNSSAEAFIDLLTEGDVTVDMHDYGNFEKVGPLGAELVRNDEDITTEPGDVILYQGNQITIYYDTNTWDFTRLGKVQGLSQAELNEVLGEGDVSVTFSLSAGETADAQA